MSAPKFVVLRFEKLKAAVAIHRSAKHTYREQDTPNAATERTPLNTHDGPQTAADLVAAINARMPAKHRKDAVQCIEVLIGGSPEAINAKDRAGQDAYFDDAKRWLRDTFGADNLVGASVHRDETSPHLVAYIVPVDAATGRLNAKRWLGGAKALSQFQTDFAAKVGRQHGLERGLEGSKARHTSIRDYYGAIQRAERGAALTAPQVTPQDLEPVKSKAPGLLGSLRLQSEVETPQGVADRINAKTLASIKPMVAAFVHVETERRKLATENRRLQAEAASQRREIEALKVFREIGRIAPRAFEQITQQARDFLAKAREAMAARTVAKERDNDRGRGR